MLIRENNTISTREMAKLIGINRRNIMRNISELQKQGVLRRIGSIQNGHWEINESTVEISDDRLGEKLGEKSDDWLGEKLGENRETILRCLAQNPSISTHRLAELLGMSTTAMDKNIKWLKDNGIIRHVGPAKGGRWEVIGK